MKFITFPLEMLREKIERAGRCLSPATALILYDKNAADRVGKDIAFATELLVESDIGLDEMISER